QRGRPREAPVSFFPNKPTDPDILLEAVILSAGNWQALRGPKSANGTGGWWLCLGERPSSSRNALPKCCPGLLPEKFVVASVMVVSQSNEGYAHADHRDRSQKYQDEY